MVVARRLSLPCTMWNLPRPGIKLLSLALAGRFLTTGPPGTSLSRNLLHGYMSDYGYRTHDQEQSIKRKQKFIGKS